ncbi:MAG TPA: hypothetical protein VG713_12225, partial [Pirellulales bacterium]|nr:hypothetical protein [Pirellulales bacterium]
MMQKKRRRSRKKDVVRIQLFSFMDVFVCMMGALVLMFMMISRYMNGEGPQPPPDPAAANEAFAKARAALVERIDELRTSRDTLAARLAEQRGELSHLEEHTRRIRDELAQAQTAAETLEHADNTDDEANQKLRKRVVEYDKEILALTDDVEQMRKAAQGQTNSYAIIPYDGPNQTRRRPIYIECRANCVILQPERIVFDEVDFMGPQGPGNPLSAGLRAVREYLIRNAPSTRGDYGEPYPLLLVRPDGIPSYYMARNAMSGWGADFGYELIEQDWKLKFKPANLALASEVGRAVEESR